MPPRLMQYADQGLLVTILRMMRVIHLRLYRVLRLGLPSRRYRLGCVIVVLFFILLFLHLTSYFRGLRDLEFEIDDELVRSLRDPSLHADKWIVITTIRAPTEAIRILSRQPGWKVVAVGDRKTPKSWSYPGVIFLDVQAQMSLGYRILRHLPFNSYSRKVIGYLYAIEHGAKYIFDTDDDNFLDSDLTGFQKSQEAGERLILVTKNLTNNPYVHFGQSTMWPRGYPPEHIGLHADRRYRLCEVPPPIIQQGTVDGDPDVDAMFRLTRRQKSELLRLSFDRSAPPYMLPPQTFAPFNSQNTFFTSGAFWALVLPVLSVPDRAVDIYRSYWAQRLMWLIGGGISFAPPAAVQIRNPHSDLVDAADESVLYQNMGRYIDVLSDWDCTEGAQFMFDCITRLSRYLVAEGFWRDGDADVVDAWLADLSTVGYIPPPLPEGKFASHAETCLAEHSRRGQVVFYPVEQNTTLPHSSIPILPPESTNHDLVLRHLTTSCGPAYSDYWKLMMVTAHKYTSILLVISVPGNVHASLPNLEAIYRPHFYNIIYCVKYKISNEFMEKWKVSFVWVDEDPAMLPCVLAAASMRYGVHGVLHISANMFLNLQSDRLANFVDTLAWVPAEYNAYSQPTLTQCYRKTISCRHMTRDVLAQFAGVVDDSVLSDRVKHKLRACIAKLDRDPSWMTEKDPQWIGDVLMYAPLRVIPQLARLRSALSPNHNQQYDLLIPLMLECDQLTVNYMHYSVETIGANLFPSQVEYRIPFAFDKISTSVDYTKQFCGYIEQFKAS